MQHREGITRPVLFRAVSALRLAAEQRLRLVRNDLWSFGFMWLCTGELNPVGGLA
jgi:hypothetical protein